MEDSDDEEAPRVPPRKLPLPSPMREVLADFKRQEPSQISLRKGQLVELVQIDSFDPSWAKVREFEDMKEGYVPLNVFFCLLLVHLCMS